MKQFFIKSLIASFIIPGFIAVSASNSSNDPDCNYYIYSDYLYLNACRSHLDYAIAYNEGVDRSQFVIGELKNVNGKWDSGFRLGFEYRYNKVIDFQARYIAFQTINKFTEIFEDFGGATRGMQSGTTGSFATSSNFIEPEYRLKYYVLDLDVGVWHSLDCDLSIRSYIGARLAWMNENMETLYVIGEFPTIDQYLKIPQATITNAYGAMVGLDAYYKLNDRLYIKTHSSIGALYGITDYRSINDYANLLDPSQDVIRANMNGSDCQSIFSSEISAGFEYYLRCASNCELLFSIGYELHAWEGFTDFLNFGTAELNLFTRDEGSLLLHGLFVRIEASF